MSGHSGHRIRQRAALDAGPEDSVVGVEALQCRQGSQVDELTLGLPRIAWAHVKPGREIADPTDVVLRKEGLGQLPQIEPSERRVLQSTVVEIEAIYVQVGVNFYSRTKTETASKGGLDPTVESIGVVAKPYYERSRLSTVDADDSA